jgi:aquaporin Z
MRIIPFRELLAEFLGIFIIVFFGTGAVLVMQNGSPVTHQGISLVFGLAVLIAIICFAGVSEAHFNPAVTISAVIAHRFPKEKAFQYILMQVGGAFAASFSLKCLFEKSFCLGATLPTAGIEKSFFLEFVMTFVLIFAAGRAGKLQQSGAFITGLVAGAVVAIEAVFGGPLSGASMNPARSLAPAILSGCTDGLWLYMLAPTLGALAAFLLGNLIDKQANAHS